ncbi:hypothetical protein Pan241w_09920 [Gimesia alba]|uniref:Uncharacterized protein n=1 Tax=Gimesia alba TaxID=2527973 RepID=A0A517RAV8_9PLAN|nr:hypothetical protein Pan241w_09920 [Gimesia alba]
MLFVGAGLCACPPGEIRCCILLVKAPVVTFESHHKNNVDSAGDHIGSPLPGFDKLINMNFLPGREGVKRERQKLPFEGAMIC